ncbi:MULTISPECIES: Imm45 family immunity protein [Photorhabdus]|uniref:Immunity protein 45 n=1 Tax=Photorhabdus luminescens TaxID=29488 RepID=A0A1G5Q7M5_PHOLU|nr:MULTISPECIES: Imm45 family immunity protein [Photorhabdus]KMW74229.1 hypothetical protein TI10_00030 [Photorhabdus luminescens subsp. luminescens]SCZ57843.1 Immunity protein 45 [Photorhabdus luminescens]
MKNMTKLIDIKTSTLRSGNVFRVPGQWPYEEFVDFMVVDLSSSERPYGLIVTSGHKAGLMLVKFPAECSLNEIRGLSTQWVIDNWAEWIYPECNVEDVHVLERYLITPETKY